MRLNTLPSRFLATLLATALCLGSSVVAMADPQKAAEYYQSASTAYQNGDYMKSADLLERAYAEDPNLIYQYNRILALQAAGKYDRAMRVLEVYAGPMKEDAKKRFEDVPQIRAQLEKQIAEKKKADAEKTDEKQNDHENQEETAQNHNQNDNQNDNQNHDTGNPDTTKGDVTAHTGGGGSHLLPVVLIGSGVALGAAAGVFGSGVLIQYKLDQADVCGKNGFDDPNCYPDEPDKEAAYDYDQKVIKQHRILTIAFGAAGLAAAVTGVLLWVMAPEDDVPDAAKTGLVLTPWFSPTAGGAAVRIDF